MISGDIVSKKSLIETVSYRVYIKHDYKPVVRWYPDTHWYQGRVVKLLTFSAAVLAGIYLYDNLHISSTGTQTRPVTVQAGLVPARIDELAQNSGSVIPETPFAGNELPATVTEETRGFEIVEVKTGENLSLIFDRLHLSPATLYKVMTSGEEAKLLKRLKPGDRLQFRIENDRLTQLVFEPNLTTTLQFSETKSGFDSETIVTELEARQRESSGVIDDSLYMAALESGLTDNLTMRLINIYGWDIDFALDIRSGDSFRVIYEEKFKDGKKVSDGSILAAEFTNRGRTYRAVRYTSAQGDTGYYDEEGYSMRKAFLRTPLNFSHISSGFNLNRKHPVLNRIRAHKGVDYAAPTGTPVKAAGDGTVIHIGKKGGYGNLIVLRHGGIYNTAYAHLHRYANGLKYGARVKQGDIIGYVGMTGLATGPHLHYEFRVNGVHRNPLTVELPKALKIEESQLAHFHNQTGHLLAQLLGTQAVNVAENSNSANDDLVIALEDTTLSEQPVR